MFKIQMYDISRDEMKERNLSYYLYWHYKKKKFYFKVFLLKKIIRSMGYGVMTHIMMGTSVSAHDMFYGAYIAGKRQKPLV